MYVSKRQKKPMSLAYLDIDELKEVNDEYGHSEGDFLICKTVEIIKKCKREADVLARVGGDEFVMILPDCSKEDASYVFERILEQFINYNKLEQKEYTVSFSFGLAEYSHLEILKVESLIQKADDDMYENKHQNMSLMKKAKVL